MSAQHIPADHVDVPCNGCTACCKSDDVYLHLECGDDPGAYQTEARANGRTVLAHQANGDCVYLGADGCRIWSHRPCSCRMFSCIALVQGLSFTQQRSVVKKGLVHETVIERGKLLLRQQKQRA